MSCDHVLKHFKLKNMKCLRQKHLKNLVNGEDAFVIQPTSSGLSIGPLQLVIFVVQNCHAVTQKSHWDKTNKGNYLLKLCMPFVSLAPVRLLCLSVAVLYHVNGKLQKAYITVQSAMVVVDSDCSVREEITNGLSSPLLW